MDTPVTQSQITDLYKTILEQENAHNTLFITILLAIVVVLLGVTWWWNKEGAKRYIRDTITAEINKQKSEIQNFIHKIIEEKLKQELDKYENRTLAIEAEVYISFSYALLLNTDFSSSWYYLSVTLVKTLKLKNEIAEKNVGKLVNAIPKLINDMKNNNINKVRQIEDVKNNIKKIPDILFDKKKEILDFLDTCANVD